MPRDGESTIIYLVRHAEKDMSLSTDDPELSAEGKARAERLHYQLKDAGITRIFSTDTRRTRSTAAPLAGGIARTVEVYGKDSEAFARGLLDLKGERILVVGHSNTVPEILNAFAGAGLYKADEAYGNLFVVVVYKGRVQDIQKLHF
jgi:broad specificity phosphatase PhoE